MILQFLKIIQKSNSGLALIKKRSFDNPIYYFKLDTNKLF